MGIIGCLLSLLFVGFFVILSFGLSILGAILRLFGFNVPGPKRDEAAPQSPESSQRQRVFEDGEGEYVDFEEV